MNGARVPGGGNWVGGELNTQWLPGWLDGWMDGWMDTAIPLKLCLRAHCSPQHVLIPFKSLQIHFKPPLTLSFQAPSFGFPWHPAISFSKHSVKLIRLLLCLYTL